MTERMAAELTWHAQQGDVRERLGYGEPPPFLHIRIERGCELFWLQASPRDDEGPPLSPVLKYDRRPSECGECSMYRFVGEFDSLEAAREGRA